MTVEGNGLTPEWVAQKLVTYDELRFAAGSFWWLQSDPEHGGSRRVMRAGHAGSVQAVTPAQLPVGGQFHAYGGGDFAVGSNGVWFVGEGGFSLFHIPADGRPQRIACSDGQVQYGDLTSTSGGVVLVAAANPTEPS